MSVCVIFVTVVHLCSMYSVRFAHCSYLFLTTVLVSYVQVFFTSYVLFQCYLCVCIQHRMAIFVQKLATHFASCTTKTTNSNSNKPIFLLTKQKRKPTPALGSSNLISIWLTVYLLLLLVSYIFASFFSCDFLEPVYCPY